MLRRPPRFNRTDTRFPSTPLFRSERGAILPVAPHHQLAAGGALGAAERQTPAEVAVEGEPERQPAVDQILAGIAEVRQPGEAALNQRLGGDGPCRSEEHTSELQSLMRISYAVLCLKKKTRNK